MSFLRGSSNYVWCTTSVLGKGATGAVYQGVNKHTGEAVAVKTFNQLSHMRPNEVKVREFEVLKRVKHENIVKLLAIEEELEGKGKVIVMELCTGGSLFNILDDPENAYGLGEEDFVLVLHHLSEGMKHLRDQNLVHRDLKPGNIMKFISSDGRTVFKLTDFGAARELEEDQQFMSLYGTEEYLHPDMYLRAVLRKPVGKSFGANVDLWSIGVTLYHIATGQLPFRPYGGRKNKETMYFITTEKASGVISGVQTAEEGPIEWGRTLPEHCRLSLGIQKHVTPLLAGLLEVNPKRMWNFDTFFREVNFLLQRNRVHVFHVNKLKMLSVYLYQESGLDDLQALIEEQTSIPPSSQIILCQQELLSSYIHRRRVLQSRRRNRFEIPATSGTSPLLLYDQEDSNASFSISSEFSAVPKFPTFPSVISVDHDAAVAKSCCSVGHVMARAVQSCVQCQRNGFDAVEALTIAITSQLTTVQRDIGQASLFAHSLCSRIDSLLTCFKALIAKKNGGQSSPVPAPWQALKTTLQDKQRDASLVSKQIWELAGNIKGLYGKLVQEAALIREWEEGVKDIKEIDRFGFMAQSDVAKLRESWQHLLRDRASRNLTYNDEQFHMLEKIKMQETNKSLSSLFAEATPTLAKSADAVSDWYKVAQVSFVKTEVFEKDLATLLRNLATLSQSLDVPQQSLKDYIERKVVNGGGGAEGGASDMDGGVPKPIRDAKQVQGLKELRASQIDVMAALKENEDLIEKFKCLTEQISSMAQDGVPANAV
ncbi:unnamed protein product [Cyprideis torosa]|uniref:Uncharacterized protein n=1 Tax=Cyprideis torosa TaxID=163714 RepID=A0A7R8W7W1_9CRUS|nr:unnamed protein product [Cyprideis torosa]CAG0887990.1 unnamed protein product [Cyprideis torosa]